MASLPRISAFRRHVAVALACGVLAACHGGGSASVPSHLPGGTPAPTPTPNPVGAGGTAATAATAAAAIQTYWAGLPHQDRSADTASVAKFMQTLPAFHNVVVGEATSVWARLPDNSVYTYFLDSGGPYSNPVTTKALARHPGVVRRRSAPVQQAYEMPDPRVQQMFLSDPSVFSPVVVRDQIVPTLNERGYKGTQFGELSLDNVLKLGGVPLSMLYIEGHGAVSNDFASYGTMTTTAVTPQLAATYAALLAPSALNGLPELGYATAPDSTLHFSVLPPFFAANVNLSGRSQLIFMNGCYSAGSGAGAQAMAAAFQKNSPGAVYLGWTKYVLNTDASETAAFVFDRVLGETFPTRFAGPPNQEPGLAERPFSLEEVIPYGATRPRDNGNSAETEISSCYVANLKIDPQADGCRAYLREEANSGSNLVLVPSIEYAQIENAHNTLTLTGEFPTTGGAPTISLGTTPADTTSYTTGAVSGTQAQLQATINPTGNGSAGYINVTIQGVVGNAVPLTQWGPINASSDMTLVTTIMDSGSGKGTLKGGFSFRGDVHPYRDTPGQVPQTGYLQRQNGGQEFLDAMPASTMSTQNFTYTFTTGTPRQTYTATSNSDLAWCPFGSQRDYPPSCASANGTKTDPTATRYFEAVLAIPCTGNVAPGSGLITGAMCLGTLGQVYAPVTPCPGGGCTNYFEPAFGFNGDMPLSFDVDYTITASQRTPPGKGGAQGCATEWDQAAGVANTCPYTTSSAPGTFPPLLTTPG
jgi:hypothetical protein